MATKRVTLNKSDGTSNSFDFTIPETAGTYNIAFTLDNSIVIDAGNITLEDIEHTYQLSFGLSDGTTISAGTFTTPMVEVPVLEPGYLTFSSPSSFTLKQDQGEKRWDGTLEYSIDTSTWNEWDGTSISSSSDGKLYLRGIGNTVLATHLDDEVSQASGRWVFTGSDISCVGNMENLLDYTVVAQYERPTMGDSCFAYLFYDCTPLIKAPDLSSLTLSTYCYRAMFNGCTGLTEPPKLPAKTIADYAYNSMFYGCSGWDLDLTHVTLAKTGSLAYIGCPIHLGGCLRYEGNGPFFNNILSSHTYTLYFHVTDEDVAAGFSFPPLKQGDSKASIVYNIYTDNEYVKDAALSYAITYTTVNVYKLDGGAWA